MGSTERIFRDCRATASNRGELFLFCTFLCTCLPCEGMNQCCQKFGFLFELNFAFEFEFLPTEIANGTNFRECGKNLSTSKRPLSHWMTNSRLFSQLELQIEFEFEFLDFITQMKTFNNTV